LCACGTVLFQCGLSRPHGEILLFRQKHPKPFAPTRHPTGSLRYSPKPALGNSRQTTPLRQPSLNPPGFGCVAHWHVSREGWQINTQYAWIASSLMNVVNPGLLAKYDTNMGTNFLLRMGFAGILKPEKQGRRGSCLCRIKLKQAKCKTPWHGAVSASANTQKRFQVL